MTTSIAGHCAKCGAPYTVPTIWHGITPPPMNPTCRCWNTGEVATTTGTYISSGDFRRIAELEAHVEALQNRCARRGLSPEDSDALQAENDALRDALEGNDKYAHKIEAENARLRKALQSIANNACCEPCQEARLVALAALENSDE